MPHNIEYRDYPENVSRKQVADGLNNYVSHRTWAEGGRGLPGGIRWLEREGVCEDYDEAQKRIDELGKGWYDQLAVRYYAPEGGCIIPYQAPVKAKESYEKASADCGALYEKAAKEFFSRKSEFGGCAEASG